MLNVQEYLLTHTLEQLETEFGVKAKHYPEAGLICLNYSQIDSPKSSPVAKECRGLIVDTDYNVVSRAFDRFFNLGEQPETQENIDWSKAEVFAKIDGSLIKIYFYGGKWNISTRGTAFAESEVNGFDITFHQLVLKALDANDHDFQVRAFANLNPMFTYIFEVTAMENRVVTAYSGYTLHYLAARDNETGKYGGMIQKSQALSLGAVRIRRFHFNRPDLIKDDLVESAKNLPNLEEGYVVYVNGVPTVKIKSPAYCVVHLLRGEGLNPKRIAELVCTGEEEEYCSYFPEDRQHIEPYSSKLVQLIQECVDKYNQYSDIDSQKDFALSVKDFVYSGVLFSSRKLTLSPKEIFSNMPLDQKTKLLFGYINDKKPGNI